MFLLYWLRGHACWVRSCVEEKKQFVAGVEDRCFWVGSAPPVLAVRVISKGGGLAWLRAAQVLGCQASSS